MKLSEIKLGSVLKHISDVNFDRPQKLIVTKISDGGSVVYCEWITRDGIMQEMWINIERLEKW
jgi:hypothetical protein